jgi:hypothetical protein
MNNMNNMNNMNTSDNHMRISDVIKFLEEIKNESGDLEVRYWKEDNFNPENSDMRWLTEFQLKMIGDLCHVSDSSKTGKETLDFATL